LHQCCGSAGHRAAHDAVGGDVLVEYCSSFWYVVGSVCRVMAGHPGSFARFLPWKSDTATATLGVVVLDSSSNDGFTPRRYRPLRRSAPVAQALERAGVVNRAAGRASSRQHRGLAALEPRISGRGRRGGFVAMTGCTIQVEHIRSAAECASLVGVRIAMQGLDEGAATCLFNVAHSAARVLPPLGDARRVQVFDTCGRC